MRLHVLLPCLLLLCAGLVRAQQETSAGASAPAMLEQVVVSGVQPGPGLWKVTRGDHVLWVLGTLTPLPERMEWESAEVEARLAGSRELLLAPSVGIKAELGFFGKLALLPRLVGVRENPGHVQLRTVVAPELYARWSALKAKYIGRNLTIERWRPLFAAIELYERALRKSGLDPRRAVDHQVRKAAQRAGLEVTPIAVTFQVDDPKAALAEFKRGSLDDRECFERTLDRIEADLANMVTQANAWATGDLEVLRKAPADTQFQACLTALTEAGFARSRGITDLEQRARQAWLEVARRALHDNASSFALLPINLVLRRDGYLAALCADATCSIEEPDAEPDAEGLGEELP